MEPRRGLKVILWTSILRALIWTNIGFDIIFFCLPYQPFQSVQTFWKKKLWFIQSQKQKNTYFRCNKGPMPESNSILKCILVSGSKFSYPNCVTSFVLKHFVPPKKRSPKNLWFKIFRVPKKFGPKKDFGLKKIESKKENPDPP